MYTRDCATVAQSRHQPRASTSFSDLLLDSVSYITSILRRCVFNLRSPWRVYQHQYGPDLSLYPTLSLRRPCSVLIKRKALGSAVTPHSVPIMLLDAVLWVAALSTAGASPLPCALGICGAVGSLVSAMCEVGNHGLSHLGQSS